MTLSIYTFFLFAYNLVTISIYLYSKCLNNVEQLLVQVIISWAYFTYFFCQFSGPLGSLAYLFLNENFYFILFITSVQFIDIHLVLKMALNENKKSILKNSFIILKREKKNKCNHINNSSAL